MIILDTDHLGEIQKLRSESAKKLLHQLQSSSEEIATTIITVEEQMRGWLAAIHRKTQPRRQIKDYADLQSLFRFFARWKILPWDDAAVDIFERLKKEKVRIGTMDLKIASIVLAHDALLLSRNLRDFQQVPGLRVEDWLT